MKRQRTWGEALAALLATAALCAACAATVQVRTDYDDSADFSRYATYSWMGEDVRPLKQLERMGPAGDSLVRKRLQRAVGEALSSKGFREVRESQADLLVAFHLAVRHKVDVTDLPYRHPHNWAYHTQVTYYDEGTLVIDLIDREQRQLVWRGTATQVLADDNAASRERIDRAVAEIIARFPPPSR
ncbi:MAG: DUF4136 domain-containing protein [Nitrospirae bacterium]|nr:DUF4136 domain-containing protein [Nitrospirota bacterium]